MPRRRLCRAFQSPITCGETSEQRSTHFPFRRRHGALGIALAVLVAAVAATSLAVGAAPRSPVAFGHATSFPILGTHRSPHLVTVHKPTLQADQLDLRNVQMNADYSPKAPQGEPAVAASLDDPLTAVAAAIDAGGDGFWIGGTTDGGRTWSNFFQSPLIGGGPAFAGDPALAYSRREHAFLFAYQPGNPGDGSSEIHVIVSRDAGKSWTPAYLASVAATNRRPDGSYDGHFLLHGPRIEVDNNPTSPHYGRVYVAYPKAHFPDGWAPLGAHASDACPAELAYTDSIPVDNPASATWAITPLAAATDANRWATPVVDDQGGVDVVYGQTDCIDGETHAFWFTRSTDGGQTFSPRVRIDKAGEFAGNPDPRQHLSNKNLTIQYSPGFAFNPVTHSLSLITANLVHAATSGADITLQQSRDYGRT
jgi:hypothetical protein